MPQKAYLWILKIGILLSFLSFLLVFDSLLFPYITSKQIYFNILIELLFVFWITFIVKYQQWRPKLSYICYGILAYFAVILVSCFISVDFNLSFWGDIERMLGFFHLAHFLVFYFIIITVMKEWKDWRLLFIASLVVTFVVSVKAIAVSPESTIGNSAYVASLLVFNIYFSLIMFAKESRKFSPLSQVGAFSWLYLLPLPFFLWAFYEQNITGANAGLGVSIIVLLFFLGILNKRKAVKMVTLAVVVVFLLVGGFVALNKKQAISEYFASKNTFQTRLIAWEGAWKAFGSHPLLGTGYGTFAITFDKYFDADFYNYAMHGATFFDRAHNNLVDIISTTGVLGGITYLSIFLALLYYLIINYIKGRISYIEFSLIIALVAGYFVQNLAVFDCLVTYISLFVVFGFVRWFHFNSDSGEDKKLIAETGNKKLLNKEIYALTGVGIVMLFIIFQYNIQTFQMLTRTIAGQKAFAHKNIVKATDEYQQALSYGSPLNRDSRATYVDSMFPRARLLHRLSQEQREKILTYTIALVKSNVSLNPKDTVINMKLARAYHLKARFHKKDKEVFDKYISLALEASDQAIQSSPERIPSRFLKAQIYLTKGDDDKAIDIIEQALELNKNYYDGYCYLSRLYMEKDRMEKGVTNLEKCADMGSINKINDSYVIKNAINYYLAEKNISRALVYYEQLAVIDKNNPKVWEKMAKLYATQGENENAKRAARKAIELDNSLKDELQKFIQQLDKSNHQFEIKD